VLIIFGLSCDCMLCKDVGIIFQLPAKVKCLVSGFSGLEVAHWPLVLKVAGSNPAKCVGFYRAKKSLPCLPSEGK
jgi:hypothetical protein